MEAEMMLTPRVQGYCLSSLLRVHRVQEISET